MSSKYLQELKDGKDASLIILEMEEKLGDAHKVLSDVHRILKDGVMPYSYIKVIGDLLEKDGEKYSSNQSDN